MLLPSSPDSCNTRYPLLLVHGVAVRDGKKGRIWGRIPEALRSQGARVYFGQADAWGTPEHNAVQLLERLPAILADSGATKVNLIAHSKGGLDSRHLIALYDGCEDELPIASLTTIATPHHGARTIEAPLRYLRPFMVPLALAVNGIYKVVGDSKPDFFGCCWRVTPSYMQNFNRAQPSLAPVYSQQFASSLHGILDDPLSIFTYPSIEWLDGPNDGLVSVRSATYDNFRGECSTAVGRGIAHITLIDMMRRPFSKRTPPGTVRRAPMQYAAGAADGCPDIPLVCEDILEFYLALVADLKARGY